MELTKLQQKGLQIVLDRYRAGERYAVVSGYAGSGKSTLINFLIEALSNEKNIVPKKDVGYACYTGKAAQVLINKGNKNAVTLHKLLFKAIPRPDGRFTFIPKEIGSLDYKIIIVDEVSMVSQSFVDLLLSHPIFVVFCGDPGQLPPVGGKANTLLDHPHIFLDEIHRQAAESGIIRLSMLIREGKNIDGFKTDDAIVIPKTMLNTGMMEWADQILCATNDTRKALNAKVRQLKGYVNPIEEGEQLICLNNEWDLFSNKNNALTNGTIGTLTNIYESFQQYPKCIKLPNHKIPTICGNFISNTGDNFGTLAIDKGCIITGEPTIDNRTKFLILKNNIKFANTVPYAFTYSYAITTWKFQGSSAGKILGFEEKFPFSKEEHKKYLYTMCTRAESRLVLVRN